MKVLGISAWYHDAAAALVVDGRLVAAAQEERFTRKRHDADFPQKSIEACLARAGCGPTDVDCVVFYDKPLLKFERILITHGASWPFSWRSFVKAMPVWLKRKLWVARTVDKTLTDYKGPILYSGHHLSHAASAFYASPFDEAAVLTVDGVGEWATTTVAHGKGRSLELVEEVRFPHSLGLLYSTVTGYLGFRVNSGEYKVMGLAPYGAPTRMDEMRKLIDLKADGSFALDMSYFAYAGGLRMHTRKLVDLFGLPVRKPEAPVTQAHHDIARSLQLITEEAMLGLARAAHAKTGASALCLAGGVALNCVANGRILREGPFEHVYIQPAAGDAGGAIGAAAYVAHSIYGDPRSEMRHAYLGPEYSQEDCQRCLDELAVPYQRFDTRAELVSEVVARLADQKVVGWYQGRMEFGPRALGHRSILADPRQASMREVVNEKIKKREGFRPFAPSVAVESAQEWFDLRGNDSPYMLVTCDVKRNEIPAVTHVDGSARVQTVSAEQSPRYHELLTAWGEATGCPVLINTSFNVRGEPIVCTPHDAYRCFRGSGLDVLVLGDYLLDKSAMPDDPEFRNYERRFAPD